MPKGYVIASIDVRNPESYRAYVEASSAAVQAHGGRFLVRGGECAWVEGGGRSRQAIIEFESYAAASLYYRSPEYQRAAALRQAIASADVVVVQGVD